MFRMYEFTDISVAGRLRVVSSSAEMTMSREIHTALHYLSPVATGRSRPVIHSLHDPAYSLLIPRPE